MGMAEWTKHRPTCPVVSTGLMDSEVGDDSLWAH